MSSSFSLRCYFLCLGLASPRNLMVAASGGSRFNPRVTPSERTFSIACFKYSPQPPVSPYPLHLIYFLCELNHAVQGFVIDTNFPLQDRIQAPFYGLRCFQPPASLSDTITLYFLRATPTCCLTPCSLPCSCTDFPVLLEHISGSLHLLYGLSGMLYPQIAQMSLNQKCSLTIVRKIASPSSFIIPLP